jgi:molybdate transport system substrate-binding protein
MRDIPRNALRSVALVGLLAASMCVHAEQPVRVFAAASLTNALNDVGTAWKNAGHPLPSLAYAASSALARQIDSGAPADVFASADLTWMNFLDERARIVPGSRVDLIGNELVLIAPKGRPVSVKMKQGFDLASAFTGKLCTGEPGAVPVGIYAQQSLRNLGWWDSLQGRVVGTDDARTALAFVERGECPLGIVYATDAQISDKVDVVARFPESTHEPIVYPAALVKGARADARAFLTFMTTSPEAAAIYARYGFTRLIHQ